MNESTEARLRQLLEPTLSQFMLPKATDKSGREADAVCAECHQFFTWDATRLDETGTRLLCHDCDQSVRQSQSARRPFAILKTPGFYVLMICVSAGLMWLAGAGREDPVAMKERDQGKAWYDQRYGGRALKQAREVKDRADVLAAQGNNEDAERWSKLAEQRFRELAELWKGTRAEPELLIGAAFMRALRGEHSEAYEALKPFADKYGERDVMYASYQFHCGELALKAGLRKEGKLHLEKALTKLHNGQMDILHFAGKALSREQNLTTDAQRAMGMDRVRKAADFRLESGDITSRALALLAEHKIRSGIAAKIQTERGEPISVLDDQKPGKDLTFEDVDE